MIYACSFREQAYFKTGRWFTLESTILFESELFALIWQRDGIYENVYPKAHNNLNREALLKILKMPEPFPNDAIPNLKPLTQRYLDLKKPEFFKESIKLFKNMDSTKAFKKMYAKIDKTTPYDYGKGRTVFKSDCGNYVFKVSTDGTHSQTSRSIYILSVSENPLFVPILSIFNDDYDIVVVEPYLEMNREEDNADGKKRIKFIHSSIGVDGYFFLWRNNYCPMFFDGIQMLYGSNQFTNYKGKPFWFDLGESTDSYSGTTRDDILRMIRDFNNADFSVLDKIPKNSFFMRCLDDDYITEYTMKEIMTFNK